MKRCIAMSAALLTLGTHTAQAEPYQITLLSALPEFNGSLREGVALYGSVDMGINYQTVGGKSLVQTQSGGEWTSKFGVFGREDLGGGLRAEFNLESGFLANNGAMQDSTSLFNRQAWVGLNSSTYGRVRFGKQIGTGLPLFVDVFGTVGTNSAYTWLGTAVVQTPKGVGYNSDLGAGATQLSARVNNAITYLSPSFAGFSTELMYAPSNVAGQSPAAAAQGALLQWYDGTTYVTGTYNQVWGATGASGTSTVRNDLYGFGVVYDTGKIVLSGAFNQYAPRLANDGIARVYTLGTIWPVGRNAFRASVVYRDTSGVHDSANNPAKDSAFGVMLGYDYTLSKRTGLYARAGFIRNYGISTVLLNNNPLPTQTGSTAPELGTTPVTVSLGMYHNF
ncbi:porin [Paraburkholderia nemoris]|jgi:Outer membrane protein (porin)|uniref:porin n=1 Tax=Paraburkholderia nemoris TaxID=2793076 RepID=UPI00190BEE35|nr:MULTISPECIES: porin [Paraburkholderia]MBK5148949.1 porin [Burkholderia sp. R-69608]MBK3784793.1 porin [Paraburkholderia aspalathi]CAE6822954.1 Outer membrane porin protein [Paraburkholderia nemoris]CAE6839154.1 Outer membrane porin protein [Paraburkholderia nemoris]CAE6911167.1 Outer membrane porin protein [Paraburkholderia nemoris]